MSRRHLALALALSAPGLADVRCASIFGDHMVLQRETEVAVWGWADPGEHVTVRGSWMEAGRVTVPGSDGRWSLLIPTPAAGGPHTLSVTGENELRFEDVLVGEVWLCSGQSNMEWRVRASADADAEIAAADRPRLRIFDVQRAIATEPAEDVEGRWAAVTPETIPGFSAVGYYFGREVQARIDVPVGLIGSNWGGTVVESWTSREGLAGFEEFRAALERLDGPRGEWFHQNHVTALHNGMIAPLVPYGIRGALWYQGESNRSRAAQYRRLFPNMIRDWRRKWGIGDFPFYFVQLAPFRYGEDTGQLSELREAQTMALALPNTGMAVTLDIGDVEDIHPRNKQDVGARLARWALARDYGQGVVPSGPLYRAMVVVGDTARLHFDHATGLRAAEGGLEHFTVAGSDRVFHPAEAWVEGETVRVRCAGVPAPVAVRYCWGATDEGTLLGGAGLPASSFRTDDWPPVSSRQ